jgi:hypothetical protein
MLRNETSSGGIELPITMRALAMDEEALRYDQMKIVLCAGHGDVEQTALFLDLGRSANTEVIRQVNLAISFALRPAFADSRKMRRFLFAWRVEAR